MSGWTESEPRPLDDHAVWLVDLDLPHHDVAICAESVSPEERLRASRFLRPPDRARFVVSHAALRTILAATLRTEPSVLRFRSGAAGKPTLDGAEAGRLHFNLSHSGAYALVGISARAPLGVDVEAIRPMDDLLRVARTHFHPVEIAALEATPSPERDAAFFACWTRKEAVVKALGCGLAMPLNRFAVSLPPAAPALLRMEGLDRPSDAWSLHHLEIGPDAMGALAVAGANQSCRRVRLAPRWMDRSTQSA